jgi:predicted RNase H-like nuclease (RuvC/YqgF family)
MIQTFGAIRGVYGVTSNLKQVSKTRKRVSNGRIDASLFRGRSAALISRNNPVGEAFMKRLAILGSAAAALAVLSAPAQAQFTSALDTAEQTARDTAASQQRIDQLDDQTQRLLNDYRANLKQLEAARRYNASLTRNIEAQERKITQLQSDIDNVEGLARAMQPLMEDMVSRFGELVAADLPFEIEDRTTRATRLQGVLSNPDMSAAQRYRLIVEAYQIELEKGRTMNVSQCTIPVADGELTGECLQIGRVALIFKTEDDSTLRIWDVNAGDWTNLNRSYLPDVNLALRMAKEQTAPNIFFAPVRPPVQAQ